MPTFPKISVKLALAMGATALTIALIGVTSVLQNYFLREDLATEVAAQQSTLVTRIATELDGKLTSDLRALGRFANALPDEALADPALFRSQPSNVALHALFDELFLLAPDGRIVADYPMVPDRIGVELGDRGYFRRAMENGPTISGPFRAQTLGEPVVVMLVPVLAADGRIRAVMMGAIHLLGDNFLANVSATKVGRTGYVFVVANGKEPTYVMHPDKSRILGPPPATGSKAAVDAIESGFEGTREIVNAAGLPALMSYHRVRSTGWTVVSMLPSDEAFAPIAKAERRIARIALVTALLMTPLVWLAALRLLAPLTALVARIDRLRESRGGRGAATANEFTLLIDAFEALMAERASAEARLRESDTRIRTITDNLPALVCCIDRDHRFTFNNRSYERWLQKPLAEITGRTVAEVHGAAIYESLKPGLEKALAGENTAFEVTFAGRDGRTHYARCSFRPDVTPAGEVRGIYGLVMDVTKLKEADASLLEERSRMANILEGTNAGTWEWNVRTGEVRVNARWAEMLGYTLEELGPTNVDLWTAHTDPLDKRGSPERREAFVAGNPEHVEYEARMRTKSGNWIWVQNYGRVSERDAEGRPLWIHGVSLDVTARKDAEEALRLSQQFMERIGHVAGVGGWQLDVASGTVTWSAETCRLHDVGADFQPDLARVIAFHAAESRPLIEEAIRQGREHGIGWDLELSLVSATGRPFWARSVGEVESVDGRVVRLIGAIQDVTARRAIERQLAENRQLLETTLDSIADAVITTDTEGRVRWLNPIAERMTGWSKDEARGQSLRKIFVIIDDETRTAAPDPVAACIARGEIVERKTGTTLLSRTGAEYGIEDSASPIRDARGCVYGVVLIFHDVSEQRRLNREMTHRATHDPLTGLANRVEFETRLQRALDGARAEERSTALLYIDLDQFKVVNDACGHAVGDQMLQQVAAMLRDSVRARDTVARLGGDEFGVILEHCPMEQAQRIAQKMCDLMEQFRFVHDGRTFPVGTSIGLVPLDRRWENIAPALQAADASCYAAKEAGRNRVHVWADADGAMQTRHGEMQWVSRIGQALDEDRFELYGQRIEPIGASAGKPHLEVLLRLREVDGSIVAPGAFLPAAERFNMATRIDRWVIREVFERLTDHPEFIDGIGLVSVNLSGNSVGDRAFHRDIARSVREARFDVRKLCFEITETAAITNFVDAKKFVDEVRAMGVKIALDDFGAGASSFSYLKTLPVDFLKIDGQFIRHLLSDELDDAAVRCFKDVARVVGVKTIAEFVETEEVRLILAEIGIDMAQGYLIHRPEPFVNFMPAALAAA